MIKYLIIFLLVSCSASAQCVKIDESTPHYTSITPSGECDVALTSDEVTAKAKSDALAIQQSEAAIAQKLIQDQTQKIISSGLVVTSTNAPTLNGTYGLDQTSQNNVSATTTYILLNGTFPGGGTTMPWIDQTGVPHVWPSVAEFKAFATAYANYIANVSLYSASNGASGSLPSNTVTIP